MHSPSCSAMYVQVDVGPAARALPELPGYPVALLQGYNGIGKTLTVRLLQALSGTLPYDDSASPAWFSMCRAIGPGRVVVGDIPRAGILRWTFDTRRWVELGSVVTDDWFDSLTEDDSPISLDRVRDLFQIHRLAGDETLLDSLANMVERHRANTGLLLASLTAPAGRLTTAELLTAEAAQLLSRVQPDRMQQDASRVAESTTEIERLLAEESADDEPLQHLLEAVHTQRLLASLQSQGPDLDIQLTQLDDRLAALMRERAAVDADLKAQTQKAAVSRTVQRELENARRTRDRHRSALERTSARLSAAAASTGTAPDRALLRTLIADGVRRLDALQTRRKEADQVPMLRDVLSGIDVPLNIAIKQGLGDRELLSVREMPVSVSELDGAARERRQHLEGLPPAPEVAALDREIGEQKARLARIRELPPMIDEVQRLQRLYDAQGARLEQLLGTGALEAAQNVRRLEGRRAELDREMLSVSTERAGLRQRRAQLADGASVEEMEQALREQLSKAGSTAAAAEQELAVLSGAAARRRDRIAELRALHAAATVDLERQEEELAEVLHLLRDKQWNWLTGDQVPVASNALGWLRHRQSRVAHVRDRLGALPNTLPGIEQTLSALAAELRGHVRREYRYSENLRTWLSQEFSRWFNQPLLRRHVLPGADAVQVDLDNKQVTWQVGEKAESRPLTAFSSGEQAFAYTQARLAALDAAEQAGTARLVVLDEFGSFIASNRLQALYDYLLQRRATHPLDQVLIILPLRDDFAARAAGAIGEEREQLLELQKQLEARYYAVQDLTR